MSARCLAQGRLCAKNSAEMGIVMERSLKLLDNYNIPHSCRECGGVMVYQGVGEYRCEECGYVDYDDYGKVRRYIETHPGATAATIELETGVTQKSIRQMLRDERIEVAPNSKSFLHCELCGKDIRSGRFCRDCEIKVHRSLEEKERMHRKNMAGFSAQLQQGEEGQKRFTRES